MGSTVSELKLKLGTGAGQSQSPTSTNSVSAPLSSAPSTTSVSAPLSSATSTTSVSAHLSSANSTNKCNLGEEEGGVVMCDHCLEPNCLNCHSMLNCDTCGRHDCGECGSEYFMSSCNKCIKTHCLGCEYMPTCEDCDESYCMDCEWMPTCDTCDKAWCGDCRLGHVNYCAPCGKSWCMDCAYMPSCMLCFESYCKDCSLNRLSKHCDACYGAFCEACAQQHVQREQCRICGKCYCMQEDCWGDKCACYYAQAPAGLCRAAQDGKHGVVASLIRDKAMNINRPVGDESALISASLACSATATALMDLCSADSDFANAEHQCSAAVAGLECIALRRAAIRQVMRTRAADAEARAARATRARLRPNKNDPTRGLIMMLQSGQVSSHNLNNSIKQLKDFLKQPNTEAKQPKAWAGVRFALPVLRAHRDGHQRWCSQCLCVRKAGDMSECGSCHRAAYCSKECQLEHWKPTLNMHKKGHKECCAEVVQNSAKGRPLRQLGGGIDQCSQCRKMPASGTMVCGGCGVARYCGDNEGACQREHWGNGGHKKVCRVVKMEEAVRVAKVAETAAVAKGRVGRKRGGNGKGGKGRKGGGRGVKHQRGEVERKEHTG